MRTTDQAEWVSAGSGEAVRSLYRLGRQYAAGIRTATAPPTIAIALLAAPAGEFALTVAVMSVVTVWSVVYVLGLLHGPGRWYTVVDIGFLTLLCLGTRWLVPVDWLGRRSFLDHGFHVFCVRGISVPYRIGSGYGRYRDGYRRLDLWVVFDRA
jgi:hypothetical protein